MDSAKYIGLDVHRESISIAVLNAAGKTVMESVIETKANTILQFLHGLRGELQVTLEEGTSAAWLYDLIQPHVRETVVCDPRRNAFLLNAGNKSDRIDAHGKLATSPARQSSQGGLSPGAWSTNPEGTGAQLSDHQQCDLARVMTRVKALYRSWGIPCTGKQIYAPRHRAEVAWRRLAEPGVHRRAEFYYQQLDALRSLRQEVRRELLAESKKHSAWKATLPDSVDGSDPGGRVDRNPTDAPPLPHQAAAMDLQWFGN